MRITQSAYSGTDDVLTILPIGDLHIGHINYQESIAKAQINKLDSTHRGLLMGDMLECATKRSIGKGLFDTNMSPKRQKEYLYELIKPKAQFIDGCVTGNHEERITQDTSLDILEDVCRELGIPYHHYKGLVKYAWNKVCYTFEIWHGAGHGLSIQTAFKQCEDMANKTFADVYCMGHVHKIASSDRIFFVPDTRNMKIVPVKQRFVLTGTALDYDEGYADMADMQARSLGFPTIKLIGEKGNKNVSVEL